MRNKHLIGCIMLLLMLLHGGMVSAQRAFGVIENDYSATEKTRNDHLAYLYELINSNKYDITEDELPASIPEILFYEIHNKHQSSVVVMIDNDKGIKKPIMYADGKRAKELRGKKHIWAVVLATSKKHIFMDVKKDITKWTEIESGDPSKLKTHKDHIDSTKTVTAKLSPLNYTLSHEGEVLGALWKTVGGLFGIASMPGVSKEEKVKDVKKAVEMKEIWSDGSKRYLYFGIAKFDIQENTINRIKVAPPDTTGMKAAYATFGNYSPSRFGVSAGLSVLHFEAEDDVRDEKIRFIILGHLYLFRPRLPEQQVPDRTLKEWLRQRSLSLSFGVEISDDKFFGRNGYFGVTYGHLFQGLGASVLLHKHSGHTKWYGALTFSL